MRLERVNTTRTITSIMYNVECIRAVSKRKDACGSAVAVLVGLGNGLR